MRKNPRVSTIVVIAEKSRALGKDNKLLWKLPGDLKRLREITMGHPLIMGRKTLTEHMGKVLDGRTNIVVSRNKNFSFPGAITCTTIEEAIEKGKTSAGGEEVFIFGGAQIYDLAMPLTDRLYLTIVQDEPEADAFFPDYSEFKTIVEKSEVMEDNGIKYYYLTLER